MRATAGTGAHLHHVQHLGERVWPMLRMRVDADVGLKCLGFLDEPVLVAVQLDRAVLLMVPRVLREMREHEAQSVAEREVVERRQHPDQTALGEAAQHLVVFVIARNDVQITVQALDNGGGLGEAGKGQVARVVHVIAGLHVTVPDFDDDLVHVLDASCPVSHLGHDALVEEVRVAGEMNHGMPQRVDGSVAHEMACGAG